MSTLNIQAHNIRAIEITDPRHHPANAKTGEFWVAELVITNNNNEKQVIKLFTDDAAHALEIVHV